MRPSCSNFSRMGRQDALNPLSVHGRPLEFAQSVDAVCLGPLSRTSANSLGIGQKTGEPVFERLVAISPFLWKLLGSVSASFGPSPVNIMRAIAGFMWSG